MGLVSELPLSAAAETAMNAKPAAPNTEYLEFNYGRDNGGGDWVQAVSVTRPDDRSDVKGDVTVEFTAKGMQYAKAMCRRQPTKEHPGKWGYDECLTPNGIELDASGNGAFVFPADKFPNGPVNIRIFARNSDGKKDIYELQLYNTGGVKWNQGIPETDPPAAEGMELVFLDDFSGPLSISKDGRGARYNAHKPKFGDFSGWPFTSPGERLDPFSQRDTYLRIAARKPDGTRGGTGLIATVDMDGEGFWAKPPCYMECRFTAQSAPGTWPAFWTITSLEHGEPGDELDIVEAYGGVGKGNPNHPGYSIVSHFWGQTDAEGNKKESYHTRVDMTELGGKSYWSTTFHTYGVRVGLKETVYYFDNIEVFRHPTNEMSRDPHCILVNYAIGGISGWPIDLERYGNGSDMYVDYIRVYE
ncbi:MAG: family 16 glycosylhydrolase [Verrucomicrobia bacterium]|nr:family 16 glycosylhydrolase [Verrucomicrobiota bacterium]